MKQKLAWLALAAALPGLPLGAQQREPQAPRVAYRPADGPAPEEPGRSGRDAREAGRFSEARVELEKALAVASRLETRSRLQYDLALTEQLDAEAHGNDPAKLERAISLYLEVLKARPRSAATRLSLARAHEELGKHEVAVGLYRRAAELEGPDRPFYQRKLAEYLERRGDAAGAQALYEELALAEPPSREAQELLRSRLLGQRESDPAALPTYGWKLVSAGQGQRAATLALDALEQSWPADTRPELLALLAAGLARGPLDAREFLASPLAGRLEGLARDAQVGPGVEQLLDLLAAAPRAGTPAELADRLSWWRERGQRFEDAPRGLWPREAIRRLLSALGRWQEQGGASQAAAAYYRGAALLVPDDPDPDAAHRLIDLAIAGNDLAGVERVVQELEGPLFDGKGAAYRNSQLAKVYEFHATLGSLYGYLASKGRRPWGEPWDPHSALFQLEHARDVGRDLDARQPGTVSTRSLHLEPNTVDYLAQAYVATGGAGGRAQANELRLESAERFATAGDVPAQAQVLKPVVSDQLSAPQKERLATLQKGSDGGHSKAWQKLQSVSPQLAQVQPAFKSWTVSSRGTSHWLAIEGMEVRATGALEQSQLEGLMAAVPGWLTLKGPGTFDSTALPGAPEQLRRLTFDGHRGSMTLLVGGEAVEIPFALDGSEKERIEPEKPGPEKVKAETIHPEKIKVEAVDKPPGR